jgi:hypothetical protein
MVLPQAIAARLADRMIRPTLSPREFDVHDRPEVVAVALHRGLLRIGQLACLIPKTGGRKSTHLMFRHPPPRQ